jgi:hypothetical protein
MNPLTIPLILVGRTVAFGYVAVAKPLVEFGLYLPRALFFFAMATWSQVRLAWHEAHEGEAAEFQKGTKK